MADTKQESDMAKTFGGMKIVTFDIETAPLKVDSWEGWSKGFWRAIEVTADWYCLSFCAKQVGKKAVVFALPDYKGYKPQVSEGVDEDGENVTILSTPDDKALMLDLWKILDDADIVVGHNSNAFDIKKVNTRFLIHGFPPVSPYKQVDTLSEARKIGKFTSNKLDDVCDVLGIGRKVKHEGYGLWKACISGVMKAWVRMKRYNVQDVVLTEKLYLYLRPWMKNHPNVNKLNRKEHACPACGSRHSQKRGFAYYGKIRIITRQRYQCQAVDCGKWSEETVKKGSLVKK